MNRFVLLLALLHACTAQKTYDVKLYKASGCEDTYDSVSVAENECAGGPNYPYSSAALIALLTTNKLGVYWAHEDLASGDKETDDCERLLAVGKTRTCVSSNDTAGMVYGVKVASNPTADRSSSWLATLLTLGRGSRPCRKSSVIAHGYTAEDGATYEIAADSDAGRAYASIEGEEEKKQFIKTHAQKFLIAVDDEADAQDAYL